MALPNFLGPGFSVKHSYFFKKCYFMEYKGNQFHAADCQKSQNDPLLEFFNTQHRSTGNEQGCKAIMEDPGD